MNWNFAKYAAISGFVAVGALSVVRAFGQTPPAVTYGYRQQPGMVPPGTPQTIVQGMPLRQLPGHEAMSPNLEMQEMVRIALSKMRASDSSEEEKKEAKATIQTVLKEIFQRDQKKRRDQIKNLEEQIARLKKQLEKRESAEEKLIELQIQLLENEGDGLSFPNAWNELWAPHPPGYSTSMPGGIAGNMQPNDPSIYDRWKYSNPTPQQQYYGPYPTPQYPSLPVPSLPMQQQNPFQQPSPANSPRPVQGMPLRNELGSPGPSAKSIPND